MVLRPIAAALVLIAALAPAAGLAKVKLAVMDIKPLGVDKSVAGTLTELLASNINDTGLFTVISREDIKSMLGFEQDKRLVGCESDAACMAEIGGALGVEYITSGSVGTLGKTRVLNLQLIDIKRAKVVARVKKLLPAHDDAASMAEVRKAAHALVRPVRKGNTGFLEIEVEEEGASIYVDERLIGTTPMKKKSLPGGFHELVIKKKGFVEWAGEVEICPGELSKMSIMLTPSQEYIKDYESRASTLHLLAWSTLGLSVIAAASSGYFFYLADENSAIAQDANSKLESETLIEEERKLQRSRSQTAVDEGRTQYTLYWVLMGASVLSAASSSILFYVGDAPGKYDEFQQEVKVALSPVGPSDGPGFSMVARF